MELTCQTRVERTTRTLHCLGLALAVTFSFFLQSVSIVSAQDSELSVEVKTARSQAIQQRERQLDLENKIQQVLEDLKKSKAELSKITAMQKTLMQSQEAIKKEQGKQQAETQESQKKLELAKKTESEAKTKLEAAQKALNESVAKREASEKTLEENQTTQKTTEAKLAESTKQVASIAAMATQLSESVKSADSSISQIQKDLLSAQQAESKHWEQVQAAATNAGQWVSFSKQIAPILQQRCLACHNEGKPRGRLTMDSFHELIRGGESGALVDLSEPQFSTLLAMVEDGSMPKDDDPLSPDQISLIRRWIELGARLDQGVSDQLPFIEIMPRPQYPQPPLEYSQTIPVSAVAIDPQGTRLLTSGYHEVLIWSVPEGKLEVRIPGVAERVSAISIDAPHDRFAVAAGTPGEIGELKIFNLNTGELISDLHIAASVFSDTKFSPNGDRIAVAGVSGKVEVFDTQTWQKLNTIHGHADWINAIAWSPDGTKIVTASRDKTAKVFDAASGDNLITFSGHNNIVTAVLFLPDGKEIVSGGDDRRLRTWNVEDAKEVRNVAGFGGSITALTISPQQKLLSCSLDQKVRVHALADQKIEATLSGPTAGIVTMSCSSDANFLVSGSLSGEIDLWTLKDGKPAGKWIAKPTPPQSTLQTEQPKE